MADQSTPFDPIEIMKVLDRHRVNYIVIGALARVIHGADEVTDGLDITPSPRSENLRRLELAAGELGSSVTFDREDQPIVLDTDAGRMLVVIAPDGTRGYDDLRRAARREPLGAGVRPSVASLGDLARMLAARHPDPTRLQHVRQIAEIEASRGRGI